ncbi:MAG: hypothetical protein OHK0022_48320 [Roseiflexaceae bacterium]
MPTEQNIQHQLEQLQLSRENIRILVRHALSRGGLAFVSAEIKRALAENYAAIAKSKGILRSWGVHVEDLPGDLPTEDLPRPETPHTTPTLDQSGGINLGQGNSVGQIGVIVAGDYIAAPQTPSTPPPAAAELEQAARKYRAWVLQRYGQIQILGMHEPVPLGDIFTDVVLLDRASAWLRHNLDELRQRASLDSPPPPGVTPRPGQEVAGQTRRLYLLGKPGSGKSTFLRYLACTAATAKDTLPILVDLKEWARDGNALLDFLAGQIARSGTSHSRALLEQVLTTDRVLLLFDGLDEVAQEQGARQHTIQAIRDLASRQPRSQVVISCRTAADEHVLEGFTYAEVADFSAEQVHAFASKWFRRDPFKRDRFLEELARPAHAGLRDLARTPLLLTLLCLSFEATMRFSERRVDLYEAALDLLLQRWDASRSIERDGLYRALPLNRKRQLLARIALETFERGELFVRRADLERRVTAFLARLPGAPPEDQIDARAVLAAIEVQHGLLVTRSHDAIAFSHLTFQEYFAARAIVENPSDTALTRLIERAPDPRWREVLLMVASLLDEEPAERFFALFVRMTHELLSGDAEARESIAWATPYNHWNMTLGERAWALFVWVLFDGLCLIEHSHNVNADLEKIRSHSLRLAKSLDHALALDLNHSLMLINNLSLPMDLAKLVIDERRPSPFGLPSLTLFLFSPRCERVLEAAHQLAADLALPHVRARELAYTLAAIEHDPSNHLDRARELVAALDLLSARNQALIQLMIQGDRLQQQLFDPDHSPVNSLRFLTLAYHIGLHGSADRDAGLAAFWRSALANLPAQPPEVQALRAALEACALPTDDAPVEEWKTRLLAVRDVLVAHQHIGLEWAGGQAKGSALGQYLAATALLHECLEQATVANRDQILEQLLTVPEQG